MAMCSPSRSSFLSGLRPDYTKLYTIDDNIRSVKGLLTIPQGFKQNGYTTVAFGKVFDGRSSGGRDDQDYPASWTVRPISFKAAEWSHTSNNTNCGYGDPYWSKKLDPRPLGQCIEDEANETSLLFGTRNYLPDEKLANLAIGALNQFSKNPSQPFFLAVGFLRPHLPFVAPQRHFRKWPRSAFPLNQSIDGSRNDIYAPVAYTNSEADSYTDWTGSPKHLTPHPTTYERYLHSYYASSSFVDEMLGKVVSTLRSYPTMADNTIILFFGDHGYHLGEHEFYNKKTVYDLGTKVTFIRFGPNKFFPRQGINVTTPVELLDLKPTLYEMAGISLKAPYHGTSLTPLFRAVDPVTQVKSVALSQFYAFGAYRFSVMSYGIRGSRYRYVVQWDYVDKSILHEELYDYIADPLELINAKTYPENANILAAYRHLFQVYHSNLGDYQNLTLDSFSNGF